MILSNQIEPGFNLLNKYTTLIIVFILFLNGFVPRFAIGNIDFSVFSKILRSESTLFRFLTLSTLPVNIVNNLFNEQKSTKTNKQNKNNNTENSANTSMDFSIVTFDKKADVNNKYANHFERNNGEQVSVNVFLKYLNLIFMMSKSPPLWKFYVFLILLMCLFILPRSNVGENAATILLSQNNNTQLVVKSWVFCLLAGSNLESPIYWG